jgi:hypothetical protein
VSFDAQSPRTGIYGGTRTGLLPATGCARKWHAKRVTPEFRHRPQHEQTESADHLQFATLKAGRMIIISGACIGLAKSAAEFFSRCGVASVNRKDTADEPDLAGPTVQFTTKS